MALPYGSDPIILAAQAREVLVKVHERDDTIVRFKTNRSGYAEDALDKLDEVAPGHFRADKKVLTLNLDTLVGKDKPLPKSLGTVEDWRGFPVLAGVAAHECSHARWSLWDSDGNSVPEFLDNPDFDPDHPEQYIEVEMEVPDPNDATKTIKKPKRQRDPDYKGPERFKVSETGKLLDIAKLLEEPRVERLGHSTFTKTWKRGMELSASHLILERVDEDDAEGKDPLDAALNLVILVGGRQTAGTLGVSHDSRQAVRKVLESAQKIIETALAEKMAEDPKFDPFHQIMRIVADQVYSDSHTDATPALEAARQILKIVHPENANDPDSGGDDGEDGEEGGSMGAAMPGAGSSSPGEGGEDGEGDGEGEGEKSEAEQAKDALKQAMANELKKELDKMKGELTASVDKLDDTMREEIKVEQDQQNGEGTGGFGATIFRNPYAPELSHYEDPNADDRALYRRAVNWMERQIQPTVTQADVAQWLPVGGARLDVRSHIRDNLAGHVLNQRTDWNMVSETVKPAPPVKLAVMLDGSGSMGPRARWSAGIGWAAANAAADLPESRTVSVVYGAMAQVTQKPGHGAVKKVAVSRTDGPWENFAHAAELVEEALWLNDPDEEGQPQNVLIVIVSDLMYGHSGQPAAFNAKTREWAERGFKILVVGLREHPNTKQPQVYQGIDISNVEVVRAEDLFR